MLDFEATCKRVGVINPQEIIEFPVLLVDAMSMEIQSIFHEYVKPTANPILTEFCTELTGITQDMVQDKDELSKVLEGFHMWLQENKLLEPAVKFCFVTCGDWDLKTMLPKQCRSFKIPLPNYFERWLNIKHVFHAVTGQKAKGMPFMLQELSLELLGRHHSGIDDSKNIARILKKLNELNPSAVASFYS